MANVFSKMKDYVEKHKRNTFDLSFTNNLTFDFGELVPVFCKEVIPGDSFSITPTFGIRLMPLVFPIQTRMNANLHFFYVRNRNLWKDWPDFIGRTKQNLVPPYLTSLSTAGQGTGSLLDYLGAPTTLVGDYGNSFIDTAGSDLYDNADIDSDLYGLIMSNSFTIVDDDYVDLPAVLKAPYHDTYYSLDQIVENTKMCSDYYAINSEYPGVVTEKGVTYGACRMFVSKPFDFEYLDTNSNGKPYIQFNCKVYSDVPYTNNLSVYLFVKKDGKWLPFYSLWRGNNVSNPQTGNQLTTVNVGVERSYYAFNVSLDSFRIRRVYLSSESWSFTDFVQFLKDTYGTTQVRIGIASELTMASVLQYDEPHAYQPGGNSYQFETMNNSLRWALNDIKIGVKSTSMINDVSVLGALSPYAQSDLPLSALPFRAYESIYNAFYRNQFNDPFIVNGQKEYNKFIANNEGDADNIQYSLHKRNYEMDFLTSAKQSPVDGDITPLVGVNAAGDFTFQNTDGTTYKVKPIVGDDGHTLTGIESMEGTPENNSGLRRLVDMISLGISINDFRNVNALQRWLETNLRRGYRYKDQIMSHFGVDVKYEELDMPEFIGGMSEPVIVNQVNQSVDQTGNDSGLGDFAKVLGSYAGQASILAQSRHSITKYCDEHGFIIGILSVTPVPCYSQLLPKYLIKNNVLDYYFPEFGHIGNQPITYKEVCPLQVYAAGDSLNDVFGYQRPWYDYLASVDEVHGDFRNTLNGFLIQRLFDTKPELGKAFIEVDKDAMTNPFSVTDDSHKLLGNIYFDVSAQRPIPKYGIPRLE